MCNLTGFETILLISTISVIAWNLLTRKYGFALIGAWITSLIGVIVVDDICTGLDPLWSIAVILGIIPLLVIVAIIDIPFLMVRYRQEQKRGPKKK